MNLPHLSDLKRVHILGICGTLMGPFAAYLKRQGIAVTGTDQNVYPPMSDLLQREGIQPFSGYSEENLKRLPERPDLVIIGNVIQAVNPEARAVIDGGYAYTSLPEAMERLLLGQTRNLVVAGTHGKTTTSSLLAYTLFALKRDPNFFIGGVSHDLPHSFHVGSVERGQPFVLEGDEYDTAFWDKVPKFFHYLPDDVILTSVEFDHADIYADLPAVERAFEGLLKRIRPSGRLIACTDFASVRGLLETKGFHPSTRILTYGTGPQAASAQFRPGRMRTEGEFTRFEVLEGGKHVDELAIRLPGAHNVANALAVWIECRELGLAADGVRQAFVDFRGVKRRQEVRGDVRGITVIDDFAHHPTAVRETLRALRSKYAGRRLVAVFEPRSATSRRKVFQADYANAFGEADWTLIAQPYDQSRIRIEEQFSSEQLVQDVKNLGKKAELMETNEAGVSRLTIDAKPGDVIAVLSNGGFGGFIPKLLDSLAKAR